MRAPQAAPSESEEYVDYFFVAFLAADVRPAFFLAEASCWTTKLAPR